MKHTHRWIFTTGTHGTMDAMSLDGFRNRLIQAFPAQFPGNESTLCYDGISKIFYSVSNL